MALLMLAGSVAAIVILLRQVGQSRQALGMIEEIDYHPELRVLEVAVRLKGRWRGHQAGQFAFVSFDEKEGAHPFTITSAWTDDGRLSFVIKELGDYTKTLLAGLKIGDPVKVEGPYGQFTFSSNKPRQIWIGGGIGITPFIARMKALAQASAGKNHRPLSHHHGTRRRRHRQAAQRCAAGQRYFCTYWSIHAMVLLTAERIMAAVPKWESSDVWFCGPTRFGEALRRDFVTRGLPADDFHHELFDLR